MPTYLVGEDARPERDVLKCLHETAVRAGDSMSLQRDARFTQCFEYVDRRSASRLRGVVLPEPKPSQLAISHDRVLLVRATSSRTRGLCSAFSFPTRMCYFISPVLYGVGSTIYVRLTQPTGTAYYRWNLCAFLAYGFQPRCFEPSTSRFVVALAVEFANLPSRYSMARLGLLIATLMLYI